jgi:NADH-quinone oxidoreductase subunit L
MTGILVVLAVLSAIGGILSIPHYLAPQLPLPPILPAFEHLETPLLAISVVVALAGLAAAAWLYGGSALRADRLRERFAGLHRLLTAKYYVDEVYENLIGRPLYWLSDRVLQRVGDRAIFDGAVNGLAALTRGTAGVLSRAQTGSLHFYALMVVVGVIAALAWTWRHG